MLPGLQSWPVGGTQRGLRSGVQASDFKLPRRGTARPWPQRLCPGRVPGGAGRQTWKPTHTNSYLATLPVQAKHRTQRRWERCGPVWDPLSRGCGLAQAPSLCLHRPPPAHPIPGTASIPQLHPPGCCSPAQRPHPSLLVGPVPPPTPRNPPQRGGSQRVSWLQEALAALPETLCLHAALVHVGRVLWSSHLMLRVPARSTRPGKAWAPGRRWEEGEDGGRREGRRGTPFL